MKKGLLLILSLLLVVLLVGCGEASNMENNENPIEVSENSTIVEENIDNNENQVEHDDITSNEEIINENESSTELAENTTSNEEAINNDETQTEIEQNNPEKTEEEAVTVDTQSNKEENNLEEQIEDITVNNIQEPKILVAFFSRADENYSVGTVDVGNTEIMAGFVKDYLGDKADTFKIDPVTPYPANYKECTELATKELNENARPDFKNPNSLDISKYDTIILGYPIWWGDVPMIINTFLEKYDFSGKNIYLFNTHEGSGNSGTYTSIKNKLSASNVNTNGLAIRGADARKESSRSTVENWLKGLGL